MEKNTSIVSLLRKNRVSIVFDLRLKMYLDGIEDKIKETDVFVALKSKSIAYFWLSQSTAIYGINYVYGM